MLRTRSWNHSARVRGRQSLVRRGSVLTARRRSRWPQSSVVGADGTCRLSRAHQRSLLASISSQCLACSCRPPFLTFQQWNWLSPVILISCGTVIVRITGAICCSYTSESLDRAHAPTPASPDSSIETSPASSPSPPGNVPGRQTTPASRRARPCRRSRASPSAPGRSPVGTRHRSVVQHRLEARYLSSQLPSPARPPRPKTWHGPRFVDVAAHLRRERYVAPQSPFVEPPPSVLADAFPPCPA
jgi:hypothetical protein